MVAPIHKKNSTLDKSNFRSVSILPYIIFERAIKEWIVDFFNPHFNMYLYAFRLGFGCQSTLLRIIEDWEQAIDEIKYVAAVLNDLPKVFDYLPQDLLLL